MIKIFRFAAAPLMALTFLVPTKAPAADFELVGLEMTRLLQNGHYARLPFDEKMSARFLSIYLDSIDSEHCYFLEAEIADFERNYSRLLHDLITSKNVMPVATGIFEIYRARVTERAEFVKAELAKGDLPLNSNRTVAEDRGKANWPVNAAALEQLWRDQLENMVLTEIVRRERFVNRAAELGKPVPFQDDPSPVETVLNRFETLVRTIESADDEDVANYFFSAVARAHDPHSEYLSANELEKFKIAVSNELVGIGARLLRNDDGETEIRGIVNGGPADKKGDLKLGDRIVAVSPKNDGEWIDIIFKPIDRVIEHILGEEGSDVGLRIKREIEEGVDETLEIVIERGIVTMKGDLTTGQIFQYGDGDSALKLGLIQIPSFYFDFDNSGNRVSVDVLRMLERMKTEGINGLALDLRGNGGGSLPEVQRLTGFFIDRGPVVQVKSINGAVEALDSLERKAVYSGPMVVLTDKGSASATEILAGALQDYHRAVVVGSASTYGKGTVQKTMDIGNYMPILADRDRAGWLKLTFQKYYRVSGSSVQIKGVVPDLVLPSLNYANEGGEGEQDYALPHDVIRKSPKFTPLDAGGLFLPTLQKRSLARITVDQDFAYLREKNEREAARIKKNSVSLNREERLAELHEEEARRKARDDERRERFAKMEEDDQKTFKTFRLTMDNLEDETLPLFDSSDDEDPYIRSTADELDDLEVTLKWPSGVDLVKREGMRVLRDLVEETNAARVAVALPR